MPIIDPLFNLNSNLFHMLLTLYNYHYIRPDRVSESLYHADPGRILSFTSSYTKRGGSGRRAAGHHPGGGGYKSGSAT